MPLRKQWQPTSVFLPGESHGQRSLEGTVHGVTKSRTWLRDYKQQQQCISGIKYTVSVLIFFFLVFVLLWLVYFTEHNVLKIHPHCRMCQNVLPLEAKSYSVAWTDCIFLPTHPLMDTWAASPSQLLRMMVHGQGVQVSLWAVIQFFWLYTWEQDCRILWWFYF